MLGARPKSAVAVCPSPEVDRERRLSTACHQIVAGVVSGAAWAFVVVTSIVGHASAMLPLRVLFVPVGPLVAFRAWRTLIAVGTQGPA